MLRLVWKSGRQAQLYPGQKLELGRADAGKLGPWSVQVSRIQCIVQCYEGGKAVIQGKGKSNPSLIRRNGKKEDSLPVNSDDEIQINHGDQLCLSKAMPQEYIEIQILQDESNPSKRQKIDHQKVLDQYMLILVGPPGCGKSTFANNLSCEGSNWWVRINQDTINNGKPGSKKQCLSLAEKSIKVGRSCVIDRCNIDAEQRKEFVQLAQKLNIPVYAVVFDISKEICMQRAMSRQGHEGGVEGKGAAKTVGMVSSQLNKSGFPTKEEGLEDIQICTSDQQIFRALQHWGGIKGKHCPLIPTSNKPMPVFNSHWQRQLSDFAKYPDKVGDDLLHEDRLCIMIKDKYPKAKHHVLVIAKEERLSSIYQLQESDSSLLLHMRGVARHYIEEQLQQSLENFRLGFHSVPSMKQLHLHVISTDYLSDSLKNKKHWNSFTSPFFLGLWVVYGWLARHGQIRVDVEAAEQLLKEELRCFKCGSSFKNLPDLKRHIEVPCL